MTIPSTPAKGKTLPCPVCAGIGESEHCTLCRGAKSVSGEYNMGVGFSHSARQQTAWLLNCPGGCAAILMCAGGTSSAEMRWSVAALIDRANHGMSKHLAEQWQELRKARHEAEIAMLQSHKRDDDANIVLAPHMFMAWSKAATNLALFEGNNGIGGGA